MSSLAIGAPLLVLPDEWRVVHRTVEILETRLGIISVTKTGLPVSGDQRTLLTTLHGATVADALEWILNAVNERVAAERNLDTSQAGNEVENVLWAACLEDTLHRHPFDLNDVLDWVGPGDERTEVPDGEIWVWLSFWVRIVIDTRVDDPEAL